MNEITLNALINLFAIFSVQTKSGKEDARAAFSSYLKQQLGMASSNEYLSLFDELIDLYGIDGEPMIPVDMNLQAERIATNLKSRLHHTEQIMVFLRFLELSYSGDIEKGDSLIQIIADTFAISPEETKNTNNLFSIQVTNPLIRVVSF